jgi:phosphoheptose isomerase
MTTAVHPSALPLTDLASPPFPAQRYESAAAYSAAYFREWASAVESLDPMAVQRAAGLLLDAYLRGATIFSCGNGGSAAIADHLQCDHLKGVRSGTDLAPRVTSLASNVDLITAIANDIGYEEVFAFQLQSQARRGDVLVAISSSGNSPNILRALFWARAHGLATIAFTGFSGGAAFQLADVPVHVVCSNYGIVEDLHQAAMHAIAQYIRQSRMAGDVVADTRF